MKLLLVEGCIGSGKTTLANELRERMKHTQLLSLSSLDTKNDFLREDDQYLWFHQSVLEFCKCNLYNSNVILARSFLSDYVYFRLGHKSSDYNGKFNYEILCSRLRDILKFADVEIIILTANENQLKTRLNRDKFQLVEHTVEEALNQQEEYLKVSEDLKQKGFNVKIIDNSDLTINTVIKKVMNNEQ